MKKTNRTFIPFNLQSLSKSNPNDTSGDIDYLIKGYASTTQKDTQGEKVFQEGIDWDTYKSFRKLKYEHSEDPGVNIGFVPVVKPDPDNNRTYVEARIFAKSGTAQHKLAKSIVDDLQNTAEYNKKHPEHTSQDVGFSMEGGKLVKSNGDVPKAIVTHLVLTYAPANTGCTIEMNKSITDIAKRFKATVNESELPEDYLNIFKSFNMKKSFTTEEEVRTFYKSLNFDEADILEKIKVWKEDDAEEKVLLKSITDLEADTATFLNSTDTLVKSFEGMEDFTKMSKSFDDATQLDSNGKLNTLKLFSEMMKLTKSMFERVENGQKTIMKTLLDKSKLDSKIVTLHKSLNTKLNSTIEKGESIMDANSILHKSLVRLETASAMDSLDSEEIDDPNDPNGEGTGRRTEKPFLEPEQVVNALKNMSKSFFDKGDQENVKLCTKALSYGKGFGYQFDKYDPEFQSFIKKHVTA